MIEKWQPGCLRDAILAAVGANADHGLRRKPEDKRRAVLTLLNDPEGEWNKKSDNEIANLCNVSNHFVAKVKKEILTMNVHSENSDGREESYAPEAAPEPETRTYTTKHGTVAKMKTGNIGKKRKTVAAPEANMSERNYTRKAAIFATKKCKVTGQPAFFVRCSPAVA